MEVIFKSHIAHGAEEASSIQDSIACIYDVFVVAPGAKLASHGWAACARLRRRNCKLVGAPFHDTKSASPLRPSRPAFPAVLPIKEAGHSTALACRTEISTESLPDFATSSFS